MLDAIRAGGEGRGGQGGGEGRVEGGGVKDTFLPWHSYSTASLQ